MLRDQKYQTPNARYGAKLIHDQQASLHVRRDIESGLVAMVGDVVRDHALFAVKPKHK